MEEEKKVKCSMCGKECFDWQMSRDGECPACVAEDRAHEMTVGDLGGR